MCQGIWEIRRKYEAIKIAVKTANINLQIKEATHSTVLNIGQHAQHTMQQLQTVASAAAAKMGAPAISRFVS